MSTAKKLPWFKLWAEKLRSDSNWRKLTSAQRGIFIDLMCSDWVEGGVPENPEDAVHECARDAKVRDVAVVLRLFTVKIGEGRVTHKHQESARAEGEDYSKVQSERAKRRWKKTDATAVPAQCHDDATAMPRHESGNATAVPAQCHKDKEQEEEGEVEGINKPRAEPPQSFSSRPKTEDDAVKLCKAQLIPVPDTFIRQCFNQLEAVDWIDGFNRPVTNFGAYVKKGYAQHKDNPRAGGNNSTGGAKFRPAAPNERQSF